MSGLYIHIPFCRSKCIYCDFYSAGTRIADWNRYTHALLNELRLRSEELHEIPSTLYVGGGTPSLIPLDIFKSLIPNVNALFNKDSLWREFTLEVNPEDINETSCSQWKKTGVNRLSIGIQSLNDEELKRIGRRHDAALALKSLKMASDYFEKVSVDIMFGLPGQSADSYSQTLRKIVETGVGHISPYSLMLEPSTAMTTLVNRKRIVLPQEDEWLEMFDLTSEILVKAGYKRYEISNFALPGHQSVHNYSYWKGAPYLGIGPSAHSYDGDRIRRANPADLKKYLDFFLSDISHSLQNGVNERKHFFSEEILSDIELREEMIMTRLRTVEGLSLDEFEAKFGEQELHKLLKDSKVYIDNGLMKKHCGYLSLSPKSFAVADSILASLI